MVKKERKTAFKAFNKPKKRRGWFAERGKHSLAAKGIGLKKKERKGYRKLYSAFILLSLVFAVISLTKPDLFSYAIAMITMVFSFVCYKQTIKAEEREFAIYVISWPFILTLAIASIIKTNYLAFLLSAVAMGLSSLTPALINKKLRLEGITKGVRDLQKARKSTETDLDKLLELLNQFGKLKISDISRVFEINKEKAEHWAQMMEENNLATIYYPAFGEEELRKKTDDSNRKIQD